MFKDKVKVTVVVLVMVLLMVLSITRSYSNRMTITARQVTNTIIQWAHFLLLQEMESRK